MFHNNNTQSNIIPVFNRKDFIEKYFKVFDTKIHDFFLENFDFETFFKQKVKIF